MVKKCRLKHCAPFYIALNLMAVTHLSPAMGGQEKNLPD